MAKERTGRKRVQFMVNRLMIHGPKAPLAVRMDATHTALYVRISNEPVVRTIEVDEEVLGDYDARGNLVGFEVIGFEAPHRSARVPGTTGVRETRASQAANAFELEAALA